MPTMQEAYQSILSRCRGERKSYPRLSLAAYREKLAGAYLTRCSGCTLGAPVEGWTKQRIEEYARQIGQEWPINNYWKDIPNPNDVRYILQTFKDYTRSEIKAIPCDDDIGYTLLALFIAEEGHGLDFTIDDVAAAWQKYITEAYTAEEIALKNLRAGVPAEKAAEIENPYDELIGADIRIDGYAYMTPGDPERAAKMAFTDAYLSHRENGIYGAMYFAAAISIAFTVAEPKTALEDALAYIPQDCTLYRDLRWALDLWTDVGDLDRAARLVDERYPDMNLVHTLNNACLTVFALALGGRDLTKIIGTCVMMAHDNDCTAATAGSLAGACFGKSALPEYWYLPFHDTVNCYFNGAHSYRISDILARYETQALKSGRIAL